MKEVTVTQLKKMLDEGKDFQLIDVREPHEYDICNLNGELIPMGEVPNTVTSRSLFIAAVARAVAKSANTWNPGSGLIMFITSKAGYWHGLMKLTRQCPNTDYSESSTTSPGSSTVIVPFWTVYSFPE